MSVIFVLLPVAVLLAIAFVVMFVWATRDGQFDDVSTPQVRVLFDDDQADAAKKPRAALGGKERS